MDRYGPLTGHNVTGIHRILVLDEAEPVHELDLSDFAGAMGREMGLDVSLGGCRSANVLACCGERRAR